MSTFSDTSPVLIKKRKGDSTDPFKPISENLKIVHNTAILNEIPDNFRRVNIEGNQLLIKSYKVVFTFMTLS
ncbi:TPA: hypothetical protein N2D16_002651 [Clostridium botulinum]|nr:hypothetical protein [Clostridium botulinum]